VFASDDAAAMVTAARTVANNGGIDGSPPATPTSISTCSIQHAGKMESQ
jgi:hypothetical protein